jgi:hypothetical protein
MAQSKDCAGSHVRLIRLDGVRASRSVPVSACVKLLVPQLRPEFRDHDDYERRSSCAVAKLFGISVSLTFQTGFVRVHTLACSKRVSAQEHLLHSFPTSWRAHIPLLSIHPPQMEKQHSHELFWLQRHCATLCQLPYSFVHDLGKFFLVGLKLNLHFFTSG